MKIIDQPYWDSLIHANDEFYGKAVLGFAERWADLMEDAILKGGKLPEVAQLASDVASEEYGGVTGNMVAVAIAALSRAWELGDELRRWHNLKYQINHEGEDANLRQGATLNTAIVRVRQGEAFNAVIASRE